MKKVFACLLAIFMFIGIMAFRHREQIQQWIPSDFSDTEMIYTADDVERYYYETLSEDGKIAYTIILSEIRNHPEEIEIPELGDFDFHQMFYALSYDNPELICMTNESQIVMRGAKAYFIPKYTEDAATCEAHRAETEQAAQAILSGVTNAMSEYDKELYLHDTLCARLSYEHAEDDIGYNTYDALVLGRAVCEGYARSMQLLLNRVHIPNYLVTGTGVDVDGKSEGHMWNVVTIGGQNYYLDATWDDLDAEEISRFSHSFFNVSEEMIASNHLNIAPEDNHCTATDANYFVTENLLFEQYDTATQTALAAEIREAGQLGTDTFEIRFTDAAVYRAALEDLIDQNRISDLVEKADRKLLRQYESVIYVQDDDMLTVLFTFEK